MILPVGSEILETSKGGTGNADGYIRTGQLSGSTIGTDATIEGSDNTSSGNYSHSEGNKVVASGLGSHAEGVSEHATYKIVASGKGSHAEGYIASTYTLGNLSSGYGSHCEGSSNTASGDNSHAEGYYNTSSGIYSHTEGVSNTASKNASHAEGYFNTASGNYSHAEGSHNIAAYSNQHVQGQYNNNKSTTLFEIGNGTSNNRKNVFEVYDDGYLSFDNGSHKIKFGVDGNGNYGYIKDGADTVYPFSYEPSVRTGNSYKRTDQTHLSFTYSKKPKYFVAYVNGNTTTPSNSSTLVTMVRGYLSNNTYSAIARGIMLSGSQAAWSSVSVSVSDNGTNTITITIDNATHSFSSQSYYVDYIF